MQQADFQRFRAVMAGMAEMYQRELSAVLLDAYWLAFKSWTLAEFEQGASHLMANGEFMPRPADFNELRKAGRETPGEAWAKVLRHAASGGYRLGRLDDSTERAVHAIGGWRAIAMCEETKTIFLERRFAEHFETMRDAVETREAVPQLTHDAGAFLPAVDGLSDYDLLALELDKTH